MVNGLLDQPPAITDQEIKTPVVIGTDVASNVGPRDVTSKETVSGQLSGILDKEGPLMTTARTKAAETASSRGLLNTTMAVQAGEQAVIESAMPIAQQDAQTYATSGQSLQESGQRMQETAFTGEVSKGLTESEYGLKTNLAESQKDFDIAIGDAKSEWDMKIREMMEQNSFDIATMNDLGQTTRTRLTNSLNQYLKEIEISSAETRAAMAMVDSLGGDLQSALTTASISDLGTTAKANTIENAWGAYQSAASLAASMAGIDLTWSTRFGGYEI